MSARAGSSLALRGMRPDLNITTVRHFLHWPHRARRPSSISTLANENERPVLAGASDDLSMLAMFSGYFEPAPVNRCAILEQGMG
jgi:hypothetical protein